MSYLDENKGVFLSKERTPNNRKNFSHSIEKMGYIFYWNGFSYSSN